MTKQLHSNAGKIILTFPILIPLCLAVSIQQNRLKLAEYVITKLLFFFFPLQHCVIQCKGRMPVSESNRLYSARVSKPNTPLKMTLSVKNSLSNIIFHMLHAISIQEAFIYSMLP